MSNRCHGQVIGMVQQKYLVLVLSIVFFLIFCKKALALSSAASAMLGTKCMRTPNNEQDLKKKIKGRRKS